MRAVHERYRTGPEVWVVGRSSRGFTSEFSGRLRRVGVRKLFCQQHFENILRAIDISRTYAYTYIHSQAAEARHRYSVAYHKRQVSLMASEVLVFSAKSTGM